MRHFHHAKNPYVCPTINVDKLWTLVNKVGEVDVPEGNAIVIDATKAGFFKVLGKGRLPKKPVIVKARFFSRQAENKIRAAGGACVLTA